MIPVLAENGGGLGDRPLNPRIERDPRLSKAQKDAIYAVAQQDKLANLVGLDGKMRPVVLARLSGPRSQARYALLRNGEPTRVTTPMTETWRR